MSSARILVVEDEPALLKANTRFFSEQGYEVITADTLTAAQQKFKESPPDLIVLDIRLPDGSGFDFCREIREHSSTPVIFLTVLEDVKNEEQGFSLGGDDYLIKPYDMNRLGIRVAAILRRTKEPVSGRAEIPPLSVDPAAGLCVLNGEKIALSPMELRLLYFFMKNPNKMINRDKLYADVWDAPAMGNAQTVVEHVYRLRKKLGMIDNPDSYFKIASEKQDYIFSKIRY